MKQLTVISGKGGTGKTTITAALAYLYNDVVVVDCDVDAADLHLILPPKIKQKVAFISGKLAEIKEDKCIACNKCFSLCRFDAIRKSTDGKFSVISDECEGCGVCVKFCPVNAISFNERYCGEWYISETKFSPMVHAALAIGAENSGRLVTTVREEAKKVGEKNQKPLVIIDGSPGIGCPVIASLTGVDALLIVSEPTLSGMHDMERILKLAMHFNIKTFIAVNKYNLHEDNTKKIQTMCDGRKVFFAGVVSYSNIPVKAQIENQTVIEFDENCNISQEIKTIKVNIDKILFTAKENKKV